MIETLQPDPMQSRHMMQSWSVSFLLHLSLVFAAVSMMPNMTIVLEQEPFKWDVALVESPQETVHQETPGTAPSVRPPQPSRTEPLRPMESMPDTMVARVAPQQSAQVVHPVIEPSKPQPVQPVQEVVAPAKPAEPQEIKKPELKEPPPVVKEVAKQESVQEPIKESVREVAPVIEPVAPSYTYQAIPPPATQPATESRQDSSAVASAPPAPVAEPAPHSPTMTASEERAAPPPSAAPAEAPMQVAKTMPSPAAPSVEPKADHRWVGESLWRRVAELKRYPSSARLNGLEGRVVLKAVIRADGNLAEVSVVKSSGHAVLDAAAMEAVKLACPLHMKHPIGPPQIVVSLPIVYSLAN